MAAAVAHRGRAHGLQCDISVAELDRNVTHFYRIPVGRFYIGNPMETWKKVAGLWTVTRNGPDILPPSQWWSLEMYIRAC